jgi:hypothetical protein
VVRRAQAQDEAASTSNLRSAAMPARFVSVLSSTGRKKARRICQKVHIKIKTKSKQSGTYRQVGNLHSSNQFLAIRRFPV